MTYLRKVSLDTNNASGDAFGRLRTSGTGNRLDVEFVYDKQEEFFDELTNNGTATFNANSRDITLSISDANNGTYSEMRSHPVPYTPGSSQLIDITGVLDLAGLGGGTAQLFLRTKVTGTVAETTVDQSSWENAKSGVDWTDSHILSMDFQSLKVGRIRYYLVQDGAPVFLSEITNDNIRNTGYWQLPSLPAFWKVYNDATYTYMEMGYGNDDNAIGIRYRVTANSSATMKAICCTVKSEGGVSLAELQGLPRSISNGVTAVTASTTLIPILSIRPKSTFLTYDNLGIAIPKSYSVTTTNPIRLAIVHDCALTGASWADVDASHSMMEYDVTASTLTGGHVVLEDYIATAATNRASSGGGVLGKTVLWERKDSITGILTIAAVKTGASDADVLASLKWDEIR